MSHSCPLFKLRDDMVDSKSNNCGNCIHYNQTDNTNPWEKVCREHEVLLKMVQTDPRT
jgi:hypothetical protein